MLEGSAQADENFGGGLEKNLGFGFRHFVNILAQVVNELSERRSTHLRLL